MALHDRNEAHPGRVLLEEFLAPQGLSIWHLAKDIDVPIRKICEIVRGECSINTDIAHRLAHYFGMSERYWLDLQGQYDSRKEVQRTINIPTKRSLRHAR